MIPHHPREHRTQRARPHNRSRRHPLLIYRHKTTYKYRNRTHLLHNHRTIRHQGPELIRLQPRIPLQMLKEGLTIRIIIRITLLHPQQFLPHRFPASTPTRAVFMSSPPSRFRTSGIPALPPISNGGQQIVAQSPRVVDVDIPVCALPPTGRTGHVDCVFGRETRAVGYDPIAYAASFLEACTLAKFCGKGITSC